MFGALLFFCNGGVTGECAVISTHSHSELSFDAIALHSFADTFVLTLPSDCLIHIRNVPSVHRGFCTVDGAGARIVGGL